MKPGSSIVMTGSVTGLQGAKELLDYSMTKGGIHAFARSLSSQLIDRGIRVNVVAPGPVWTPLNPADRPAKEVAEFGSRTAMKRAAQPDARTGLCVPGRTLLLELHNRRDTAHNRRLRSLALHRASRSNSASLRRVTACATRRRTMLDEGRCLTPAESWYRPPQPLASALSAMTAKASRASGAAKHFNT